MFRTNLGETVFKTKYASNPYETWEDRAHTVVNSVCGDMDGKKNNQMDKDDRDQLVKFISTGIEPYSAIFCISFSCTSISRFR